MAIVRITLSQDVVDKQHALADDTPVLGGDPSGLIDFFTEAVASIEENYSQFTSWNVVGSTLRTTYADGAVGIYSGLALDNPAATRGRASVTGFDFSAPGLLELGVTGKMAYDYDMSGGGLSFDPAPEGMTINGLRLATRLPSTSADVDPTFGNLSMSMSGAVTVFPSGVVQGTVNRIELGADKFIRSVVVDGVFTMSSGPFNDQTVYAFGGTLGSFSTSFHDGSLISVSNTAVAFNAGRDLQQAVLHGSAGDDDISIELPGRLYEDMAVAAGAGDDIVALKGGGGRLRLDAGDGNDVVSLLGDRQLVDGGRGTDTVKLAGAQADYVVKRDAATSQVSVTDKSGALSTLVNVERIVFGNATVALDVEGNAGQAYRLYQAAFARTPDSKGLGYWIDRMDKGLSLRDVAADFMTQSEFKTAYGGSQSNVELVTRFYQNILGRAPEAAGRDFWVTHLDNKAMSVAEVLAAISESGENQTGLADVIGNGFAYTPWG